MTHDASAGGGAAAARTVLAAAQVAAMVARNTEGMAGLAAQASALERRAIGLEERNTAAFESALAALRGTDRRDLGNAMSGAADVPGEIAEAAADVGALAAELARTAAPDLRADATAAAVLAEGAAAVAAHLVGVNLTVADGDPRLDAALAAAAAAREARDVALAV